MQSELFADSKKEESNINKSDNEEETQEWIKKGAEGLENYITPIEVPFGVFRKDNQIGGDIKSIEEEIVLLEDCLTNELKVNILQLPPGAFKGEFLREEEPDEQEIESIDVDF